MQIPSTTGTTTGTQTDTSAIAPKKELGKDDFLQLLITQMRYQDPLSPMDNQAFLSQMAQFSSLEQMKNLNDKFDASMSLTQSLNNSTAASFIGRQVRASGENLRLSDGSGVEIGYFLPQDAANVAVTVSDSKGNAVRTLVKTEGATGAHRFTWDGRDDNGEQLAAGSYTFKASATDKDGASVPVSSVVTGLVTGVTYKNGSAYLLIDGREVSLSEVLEVYQDQP